MYEDWMEGPDSGFSLMAGLIATKSRGNLRLSPCDPHARAPLNPNILADTADLEALNASVRQCREIGAAPALREEWGARELYPGPAVEDEAQLTEYVRRTAITYHHQVGTCKMGGHERKHERTRSSDRRDGCAFPPGGFARVGLEVACCARIVNAAAASGKTRITAERNVR